MIDKLKKEEKEVQDFIKEWEKYETSNKKHYNIPLPHELQRIGWDHELLYNNKKSLNELKGILSYINVVCDYYDNNDYIVNQDYCMGNFTKKSDINCVKITEKYREISHKIRENLKRDIERRKKFEN